MTARLLVIGLDAVETPLLERLADEGRLPALDRLRRQAVTARMQPGCMDLLPGAIWQDLSTGRSVAKHGDFFPSRIHTGESVVRAMDPSEHAERYYWAIASRAGRRVAAIDQPLMPVVNSIEGATVIAEWHVHDQLWGRGSHPPELLEELEARHGRRPLDRCDAAHDAVHHGDEAWLEHLLEELRIKTDVAVDLISREDWDLFSISYSDGHCAGHQMWHLHDPTSPLHPASVTPRLRGAVEEVYVALDGAISRLLEASAADTSVVFTSHGMDRYVGGPQLLPPLLASLGMGDPRRIPPWLRRFLPVKLFQRAARRQPDLGRRVAGSLGARGFLRPGTRAMELPNNRVGAIRLNVAGREPAGVIDPSDVDAELDALTEELVQLRQPASGERIVHQVVRPADVYGPDHHPDLPDLLVVFRRDLGELTQCEGPRSGHIEQEFRRPDYQRTGDHTAQSRVWVSSDAREEPRDIGDIDNLDLAPTLLALLEVPAPDDLDGVAIPELVGDAVGPR